ncbi:MAG: universal stress protein [bacterium]|jgi:nucleotide-binding universal stress UspA family protein
MSEKIITLATLTYMRAQLLSAMLERNGIDCFMTNMDEVGGVKVKIRDQDSAKAYKIFEDFKSSYGERKSKAVEYMKSIRRILVPVDFTEHAENAAEYALHIASYLKADIKLINAYLDPMGTPQTYLESYSYQVNIDRVIREVEIETGNSLKSMAGRLKEAIRKKNIKGVDVYYDLFKGNAVDVILNEIDDWKPALVVMGTRGNELEGIRSFGSVTGNLISKVKIPLLAVPKDYDAKHFKTPKRVLYATNFDETDFSALRRLVNIIQPFNAKIYCVHAALEESSQMDEAQLRKIRNYMYENMGVFKVECGLLETMDLQQGLEDFIKEQEIDVLAVTTQRRNFIMRIFNRSMTRKFLFHSDIPLLVFQSSAKD